MLLLQVTGNQSGILISQELEKSIRFNRDYQTSSLVFNICESTIKVTDVFDNTWKHIVVTLEQGIYLNIIINGNYQVKNKLIKECIPQSTENICIGANCVSGSLRFDGKIDKVGIFNKTLNKQEISNLSTYPNCPFYCETCSIINGNLQCDQCKGDRQLIGNICDYLNEGKYDDMQSYLCQDITIIQIPKDDPLLLYFPMDSLHSQSIAMDESGQQNQAFCFMNYMDSNCFYTQDNNGQNQMAMQFGHPTYQDHALYINSDAALKLDNKDFTIMFKFQINSYNTFQSLICELDGSGISIDFNSYWDSYYYVNYYYLEIYIGGQYITEIYLNYNDFNWHDISIRRYDQTKVSIIFNDQYNEFDITEINFNIDNYLVIGNCYLNNQYNRFYGNIDEIRIYQKKLTQAEIKTLQNFPLCPDYCPDCIIQQGRFICNTCRGNRIIGNDNYTCICPDEFEEKYSNLGVIEEFCVPYNNFQAYYNLDQNLQDLSPNQANQGIIKPNGSVFAPTQDRNGNENSALDLSNSIIQVQLLKNNYFDFKKQDFTISFWVKGPVSGIDSGIIYLDNTANLLISRDYITQDLNIQIAQKRFIERNFFTDEWKYLTLVRYNVEFIDILINSQKTQTINIGNVEIFGSNNYIAIGAFDNPQIGQNGIFDGQIDELRVYNKKLSNQYIQAIMNFPDCPFFCPDCTLNNNQYITVCNTCKGDRILDNDSNFCICPDGYYDDFLSDNCQIIQQTIPLILYYSFDIEVNGVSQNPSFVGKNNGIQQNTQKINDRFGVQNRSYEFLPQSNNSKIIIDNLKIFDFELKDFTIAFWLKGPINSEYLWGQIIGNELQEGLSVLRYSNSQDIRISINGVYVDVPNVFIGDWQFVSIIRQSDSMSVVINEEMVVQNHYIGQISLNSGTQVCIGRSCDSFRPFDGAIDELRIYEIPLSLQEILEIKNYKCIFPCLECDYQNDGNSCLSCKGDRIFDNNQCLCPDGYYDDFTSNLCQQCPYGCLTCSSPNDCDQCIDINNIDKQFRIPQNVCACPIEGYYDTDPYCETCNNKRCLTCTEKETCNTCVGSSQNEKNRRQQSKTCSCPSGYYDEFSNDQQLDCIPCEVKTKSCTLCELIGGICIECQGDLVYEEGVCQCPKGTYPKDLSNPDETSCEPCPSEKAECLGGYEVQINSGYWRQDTQSDNILECYNNKDNCIGGTGEQLCKEGSIGALCEACDIDNQLNNGSYANSSEYECSPCSEVSNNGLKIFALIMLQMISLYLAVIGTITAMQDQIQFNCIKLLYNTGQPLPDEQGVLIKILQNYLYIISAILTFQIELPSNLSKFTNFTSSPAKAMAYSFDCTLNQMQDSMPNLYFRIIWQIIIGIFQLLLVYFIGFIMIKNKKTNITFVSLFWTSLIYQYIALQPAILTMILEAIACREIGGISYILSNTSIKCYDQQYNTYTYGLLMPLLFIWVIVIPVTLFLYIRKLAKKQKNKGVLPIQQTKSEIPQNLILQHKPSPLEKTLVLQKFGYLYLEYKQSVYWWEFVKIFQRIIIATVLSFYYIDIYVKGILVFMTVVIYGVLQYKYHPYKIYSQNQMDQFSILVIGMSLIIGLFLYENSYSYLVVIAVIILVFINIYLIIQILRRILRAKGRTAILKITQQKEKYEHQEIYLQKQKELEELKINVKEYEMALTREVQQEKIQELQSQKFQIEKKLSLNQEQISQLDLLHIEDLKNKQQKVFQRKKQQKDNKGLVMKFIAIIDKFQVKYMGYADQETLQQAKQCKFQLRKYIGLYIDGINAGLVEPLYEKESILYTDTNQQLIQQKKQNTIFSAMQLLKGQVTEDQYQELQQQLKLYKTQKHKEELLLQEILKDKIVDFLKQHKFPNKYILCEKFLKNDQKNQQIDQKDKNNNEFKSNDNYQIFFKQNTQQFQNYNLKDKQKIQEQIQIETKDQFDNLDDQVIIQQQNLEGNIETIEIEQNDEQLDNQSKSNQEQTNNQKETTQIIKNLEIDQNNQIEQIKIKEQQIIQSKNIQKEIIISQNVILSSDEDIQQDNEIFNLKKNNQLASYDSQRQSLVNNQNNTNSLQQNQIEKIEIKKQDSIINKQNLKQLSELPNKKFQNDQQLNNYQILEQSQNKQENYLIDQNKQKLIGDYIFSQTNINQIKEFLVSFKLLDTSNKGKVSKKQMVQIMKKLNINIYKGQIDLMYEQFDYNESEVNFVSFVSRLLKQKYYQKPQELLREIYSKFDIDSNGCLGFSDMKLLIQTIIPLQFQDSVYKQIVLQEDRSGNGGLTLNEFIQFVL